jgi:hypothetical protein
LRLAVGRLVIAGSLDLQIKDRVRGISKEIVLRSLYT